MERMSPLVFVATALLTLPLGAESGDFMIIKGRVIAELMKSSIDDGEVKAIVWGRELRYRYCSEQCHKAHEKQRILESAKSLGIQAEEE